MHLNLYFVKALRLEATVVELVAFVVGAFGVSSLISLNNDVSKVGNRRWCPKLVTARYHVVNYYPAVVASGEDPVHILVADTANVLESGARLGITLKAPSLVKI